jgi:hypothetical protein
VEKKEKKGEKRGNKLGFLRCTLGNKLSWAKVVVGFDGNMNMVRCHVCT